MSTVAPWQPDWKTIDGNRFQDLCLDLLSCEGYKLQDQGVGTDGGVDAILVQTLDLPDDTVKQIRWVAQFKFKVNPEATVKPGELGNVENILGRFQAEGFFLITNGRVTNKALLELRGALARCFVSVWTRRHIEQRLVSRREVACRYFPLPNRTPRTTATLEVTVDLPYENFSELQQRLFRHALASFLDIPVASVSIREISKGSTKVTVEVPEEAARLLRDAFDGDYLALDFFGFAPAILSVAEPNPAPNLGRLSPAKRSRAAEEPGLGRDQMFSEIYKRYHRSIVAFFVRQEFPLDTAQGLAQETFVRVYRSMDQYQGGSEWHFLQTTARRLALNEIRARNVHRRRSAEAISLDDLPLPDVLTQDLWTGQVPASPEQELAELEETTRRRKWLHNAIAELPEGIRACLLLRLSGFKYGEIQAALNISMDAVKSRLHDARKRLRERMASEGEEIDSPEAPKKDDNDQQG